MENTKDTKLSIMGATIRDLRAKIREQAEEIKALRGETTAAQAAFDAEDAEVFALVRGRATASPGCLHIVLR